MPLTVPPPQHLECWAHEDKTLVVTLAADEFAAEDVATWTLETVVYRRDGTIALTVADGSHTATGELVYQFVLSPDAQSLPAGRYSYVTRRTDVGLRNVMAWGQLRVKSLTAATL